MRKLPFAQLKEKVFNRILMVYSLILILVMFMLLSVLSNYYTDVVVQREHDKNMTILKEVQSYFERKNDFVSQVIREMYSKDDLIYDISYALQNSYSSYLSYKLDKYSDSSSFVPYNMESFVETYFSDDSDINAISFASEEYGYEYLFVFNYFRWGQSFTNKSKAEDFITRNKEISNLELTSQRELKDTYILKRELKDPSSLEKLGDFQLYFSFHSLHQFMRTNKERYKGQLYVFDKNNNLVYSSSNKSYPKDFQVPSFQTKQETVNVKGEDYLVSSLADDQLGLSFVSYMPKSKLQQLSIVLWTMIFVTILLVIIAIFVTFFIMRSYSSRIRIIESSMKKVQKGDLDVRVPISEHKDELSTISITFNQMLERLKEYINQVYISDIKQKEAEMKALQTQINPHFLYNSLETIRMKAISEGARTSADMIVYLGKLFRYSLGTKQMVRIEEELSHIEQFLKMYQIRFPNRLQVEYDLDEACQHLFMMRFTLQPIVENYMIHGFRKQNHDNLLEIAVSPEEDHIRITIKDNGKGISEERLKEIHSNLASEAMGESIGLHNVHQRIQIKYGKQYGLQMESTEGQGTCVTLILPILKGESEDV